MTIEQRAQDKLRAAIETSDGGSGSSNAPPRNGESADRASVGASAADPPDSGSTPPPSEPARPYGTTLDGGSGGIFTAEQEAAMKGTRPRTFADMRKEAMADPERLKKIEALADEYWQSVVEHRDGPETGQPIPDEAEEAAAKALTCGFEPELNDRLAARAVLTAALPHLEAAIRADTLAKVRERVIRDWQEREAAYLALGKSLPAERTKGHRDALAAIDKGAGDE